MNLEKEAAKEGKKRARRRERVKLVYLYQVGIFNGIFYLCIFFLLLFSICMFHSISFVKKKTVLCINPMNTLTHSHTQHIHWSACRYYELHWNRCAAAQVSQVGQAHRPRFQGVKFSTRLRLLFCLATAPAEARPPTERAVPRPELGSMPFVSKTHHAGAATSRL